MKISEVMTKDVEYMAPDASLKDAAVKMREKNCGFLPVSNATGERLAGIITDRDIAIRAVAKGLDPETTTAGDIMSNHVNYCYADDDIESATKTMCEQAIYRLVVLTSADNKKLCGVISLGDILRHDREDLAARTAKEITRHAA